MRTQPLERDPRRQQPTNDIIRAVHFGHSSRGTEQAGHADNRFASYAFGYPARSGGYESTRAVSWVEYAPLSL